MSSPSRVRDLCAIAQFLNERRPTMCTSGRQESSHSNGHTTAGRAATWAPCEQYALGTWSETTLVKLFCELAIHFAQFLRNHGIYLRNRLAPVATPDRVHV